MSSTVNRRELLKFGSLAALGMGLRLPSFGLGNEEGILRNYGMADG